MKDLARKIYRQRLVIEGIPSKAIKSQDIKKYLSGLSEVLKMITLLKPVTHQSTKYGWAGWIHWESSGAHFYAWDKPKLFFSVDIYTCKKFSNNTAIDFTKKFFYAREVVFKSI